MRKVKTDLQTVIILLQQVQEFNGDCEKESFKLPGNASYSLFRNDLALNTVYNKIYLKKRTALLEKYAQKEEDGSYKFEDVENGGKRYVLTDDAAYDKEHFELLNEHVDIELEYTGNISKKMENVIGEQRLLNKFWYLIETFNNFGKIISNE